MKQLNIRPSVELKNTLTSLVLHHRVREFEANLDRLLDYHRALLGLKPIDRREEMSEEARMGASQ